MRNISIALTEHEVEFILAALDKLNEGASPSEHCFKCNLEDKIVDAVDEAKMKSVPYFVKSNGLGR